MADFEVVALFFSSEYALAVAGNLVVVENVNMALKTDELAVPAGDLPDAELVAGPEEYLLLVKALEIDLRALQH